MQYIGQILLCCDSSRLELYLLATLNMYGCKWLAQLDSERDQTQTWPGPKPRPKPVNL